MATATSPPPVVQRRHAAPLLGPALLLLLLLAPGLARAACPQCQKSLCKRQRGVATCKCVNGPDGSACTVSGSAGTCASGTCKVSGVAVRREDEQCGGMSAETVGGVPGCSQSSAVGRPCRDAAWSGVRCAAGLVCTRDPDAGGWWWSCQPGSSGTLPPDPCAGRTCSGHGSCAGRVCTCTPGWKGTNCETADACAGKTCSGRGACSGGLCACNAGWTGANCETQSPESSGSCPSGWFTAALTVYDSWPYPNTEEWNNYDGGKWMGKLAFGPEVSSTAQCGKNSYEVLVSKYRLGSSGAVQTIPDDPNDPDDSPCRLSPSFIKGRNIASVFQSKSSSIGIKVQASDTLKLRVATPSQIAQAGASAGVVVDGLDTCADTDCGGCCTTNANTSPSRVLIDLEKNTMKRVVPGITGFAESKLLGISSGVATYPDAQGKWDVSSIGGFPGTICFKVEQA